MLCAVAAASPVTTSIPRTNSVPLIKYNMLAILALGVAMFQTV
jgi:hypothetical protein